MIKKDYLLVSIIGAGFGLFLTPVLENIQPAFWHLTIANVVGLAVFFGIFANFALATASFLSHSWPAIWQFAKYAAVGSFNSLLDIGLLNFLSFVFGVYRGPLLAIFNVITFSIAVTNSYFWNKFWVFESAAPVGFIEYLKFVVATVGGVAINTAIVYLLTLDTPIGFSLPLWENVAKLAAVVPTLIWNFFAYRTLVFHHRHD